jgi:hypothetical protein
MLIYLLAGIHEPFKIGIGHLGCYHGVDSVRRFERLIFCGNFLFQVGGTFPFPRLAGDGDKAVITTIKQLR